VSGSASQCGYHPAYKGPKARKRKNARAADDELRKRLENVTEEDMKKFDKALEPAIQPKSKKPEQE
jgi:hypothetical protein